MKKHIFFLSLIILALTVCAACEKEQPYRYFFAEDTPQSLIVQMQSQFTIEQIVKEPNSYIVIFHNPSHFVSKTGKVYPDGIKTITVEKDVVSSYLETVNSVVFKFKPYHRAQLYYYNKQNPIKPLKLSIQYDEDKLYRFDNYDGTIEIPFTIIENTLESELQIFQKSDSPVKAELQMNADGKSGKIILFPNIEKEIDQKISFNVGTEEKNEEIKVQVIRKEMLFLDNHKNEITLELDDIARTWWVNLTYRLPEGKKDYSAEVTKGQDWISLEKCDYSDGSEYDNYPRMSNIGATQFLKFKHFIGSGTRKGTIIIKREGCIGELRVNVIQSGSENPGSIRGALMALYNQCGGSEWKLQKNWGSDLDVEEWCGIHFRNLSVSEEYNRKYPYDNGYAGIGNAYGPPEGTALEFDFWHEGYWNVIKGKIPDEFWNIKCGFKYFTVCFVENADINKVPASMWTPKLRGIELNNMQNGMPAYLCTDLSNISKAIDAEFISLHGKNFSGQLPDDIGKMKKLKHLDVNGIDLEKCQPIDIGPCPASILECESLEYLRLDAINNTVPTEIVNLPNMKYCCYGTMTSAPIVLIDKQ